MGVGDVLAESGKYASDRDNETEISHVNRFHTAIPEIASTSRNWNSASRKMAFQFSNLAINARQMQFSSKEVKHSLFNASGPIEPHLQPVPTSVARSRRASEFIAPRVTLPFKGRFAPRKRSAQSIWVSCERQAPRCRNLSCFNSPNYHFCLHPGQAMKPHSSASMNRLVTQTCFWARFL